MISHFQTVALIALLSPAYESVRAQEGATGTPFSPQEIHQAAMDTIEQEYVDSVPLDPSRSAQAMADHLDPFSFYVTKAEWQREVTESRQERLAFGFHCALIEHKFYITALDDGSDLIAAGVMPGDEIISVNGFPVRDSLPDLLFKSNQTVEMQFYRPENADTFLVTANKRDLPDPTVGPVGMLNDTTAYIRVARFALGTAAQLQWVLDSLVERAANSGIQCSIDTYYDRLSAAMSSIYRNHRLGYRATKVEVMDYIRARYGRTLRGLVIDLRGNPGGYVKEVMSCLELFVDRNGLPMLTIRTRNDGEVYRAKEPAKYHDLHLAVLVDNNTCSAAEIFAGVMQDLDRAVIIGEPTIGKALVMRYFDLPNGDKLYLAIGRYTLPSGRMIQRAYCGDTIVGGTDRLLPNQDNESHAVDADLAMESCEAYKTQDGREVYGGEGIIPDVIESENFNRDHPEWFMDGMYRAAMPYLQSNLRELQHLSLDSLAHLPVPDSVVNQALAFARSSDTSHGFETAQLASQAPAIIRWILAYSFWKAQGWFEVRLRNDPAVRRGAELLANITVPVELHSFVPTVLVDIGSF